MKPVTRRSVMTGAAAAVAVVPLAVTGAKANNVGAMAVWSRYMDAECKITALQDRSDHVRALVADEWEAVDPPWTTRNRKAWEGEHNFTSAEIKDAVAARAPHDLTFRQIPAVVIKQDASGVWTVKEFKPNPIRHLDTDRDRNWNPPAPNGVDHSFRPIRWEPYPAAKTGDEAYAMSVARAKKEWRAFLRRRKAVERKHDLPRIEQEYENFSTEKARLALARLPTDSALTLAVRLAPVVAFESFADDVNTKTVKAIYRHSVRECGYDPAADLLKRLDAVSRLGAVAS